MIASAPPRLCPVKNRACSDAGRFVTTVLICGQTVSTAFWKPLWRFVADSAGLKSVIQSSILSGSVPENETIVALRPPAATTHALFGGRPVTGSLLMDACIVNCQAP